MLVDNAAIGGTRAAPPDCVAADVDPGYTATDSNDRTGVQTVAEGADAVVRLASEGPGGPTGVLRPARAGPLVRHR
ncbi:hypothetical protein [Nocardia xishanensis]|uniref:Uncharacterized protein n=1 Tax=Nocardia xishanensis TaxID=238964 RepID=A0ABW7WZJ1_9NOCA